MPKSTDITTAVDLFWLPLGAGGRSIALNGRILERAAALRDRRPTTDLYHSALSVTCDGQRFAIEMPPATGHASAQRGVVAGGAVGSRWAGRSVWFRYEVRLWPGGEIDDVASATGGPVRLSDDPAVARRLVELVPDVPTPVWGRDELETGGMWNSNSLTSYLIAQSGLPIDEIHPRPGDRAPGWHAGIVLSQRAKAQDRATPRSSLPSAAAP